MINSNNTAEKIEMTFLRLENAAALLENKIKNKHSGVTTLTLETFCMKVSNVCLSCHFE